MITAGIDSGFQNTKAVILENGKILSQAVTRNDWETADSVARRAIDEACRKADLSRGNIEKTVATGAGGKEVLFDVNWASEAKCLVMGTNFHLPTTKTVLDMGAYKSMAVGCDGVRLRRVSQNTKCAASSGIYLERVAAVLHIGVEEMGSLSRLSTEKVEVFGSCAVFGESAVISLLHLKKRVPDILKGIFDSIAHQIHPLLADVGMEKDFVMCGGVAKNVGILDAIKQFIHIDIFVPDPPDTVSALGAALIAEASAKK